ncbi:ATP-grasp domain-containing protein [Streptomyces sp. A7024]|uniref:ATP-grasp domain-containing protein n=1 Tax=Streptomyces coryli TaxID=1128680 RepID=A0A6G4UCL6_9ACTN|nr:ATP-grasp domain-containing protein [Streptomyces coryli]NGN69460.1 ATP-grasp domain-containing protein [Streptomyces coryli]
MPADRNIFVLGLDDLNLRSLGELPAAADCRFHPLLTRDELQFEERQLTDLLDEAQRQLREFDGTVDAIVGYRDFPVTTMLPILCHRFGLRSPSLESVVKCEHKYWSRLEQRKVIDEHPRFALLDLEEPARLPDGLNYPVWIKPVKSYSSKYAYKVRDDEQFCAAVAEIKEGIEQIGKPFEYVVKQLELPRELADAGPQACIVEESMPGDQATVEGYVQDGRIEVYGVVDSHTYPDTSSFLRYQYPSALPGDVQDRLADISRRVIRQIGLDHSTFCIEFFYDPGTGAIGLLEVNPRHSQSHAELFSQVDGVPNHHCMVSLALGENPRLPFRQGPYAVAAKWYLRRFRDGLVRHRAGEDELRALAKELGGVDMVPVADAGMRLSEAPEAHDSYSYELAHVYVGADDEHGLREKYERCVAALDFVIDDTEEDST